MRIEHLVRLGAIAALIAGALRTTTAVAPEMPPGAAREVLYLIIDILILFGICRGCVTSIRMSSGFSC